MCELVQTYAIETIKECNLMIRDKIIAIPITYFYAAYICCIAFNIIFQS